MSYLRALDEPAKLDRYLEIKSEMKRLESELDGLKDEIFYALEAEPGQKCEHLGCALSIQYRTSYEYTPETQIAEQEIKARKKYEESAGIAAVVRQTGYVVVKAAKS